MSLRTISSSASCPGSLPPPIVVDLMVQEVGFGQAQSTGLRADRPRQPSSFLDDTPTSKLIRQILGAVSEFDKAMVVAKLKGARERKRALTGK
jgi:hypothetical protein